MRQCNLCGKSHIMARKRNLLRGHYNPTPKKKKKANLQHTRHPKTGKRVLVCAQCLRTLSKTS